MTVRAAALAVLVGLLLVALCLFAQDAQKTTQLIPAAQGGKVKSPSGKAVLTIPPGALAADTEMTMAEMPKGEGPTIGPVYDLQPDGLKLQQPATLTISYSREDVPEGFEPEDVAITQVLPPQQPAQAQGQPGQTLVPPTGYDYLETAVDAAAGTASAQLEHLSRYSARAYAVHKIGDNENRRLGGMFDYGMKFSQTDGAGSATANFGLLGELFAKVAVPVGKKGAAFAHADVAKWFRVKAGADGRKSTNDGTVSVHLVHNAKMSADTNQYHISIGMVCHDAKPAAMGTPSMVLGGPTPEGRFQAIGIFNQNYYADPQFGHITKFPLGPRYKSGRPIVMFQKCKLVAGRYYSVTVSLNVTVNGEEPDPENGIPAKGGSVSWLGALGEEGFLIDEISVTS